MSMTPQEHARDLAADIQTYGMSSIGDCVDEADTAILLRALHFFADNYKAPQEEKVA